MPIPHHMLLETTHPSGAEEWFCPTCGRRFLMHWPPAYNKIVLEPGDEYAIHDGDKGGLHLHSPHVEPGDDSPAVDRREGDSWAEWLDDLDFDGLDA